MGDGEFDLIARLVERLPPSGPRLRVASGDDAAIVEPAEGAAATTIDSIIEGVHFTLPQFSLAAVGRKAMAAALSDLAAMGAEPGEAYVALGAPDSLDTAALLEVGEGLTEVAEREHVTVAGGDVSASPALMLTVACVGYERPGIPLVTREGASVGDAVVVTGELGGAAAALALLAGTAPGADAIGSEDRERLLARQLDPRPRIAAGRALARAGATAMIDVSDGLGAEAGHLARAAGERLEIELESVPRPAAIEALAGDEATARAWTVSGGEDYELLATVAADRLAEAASAVEATGVGLTQIGEVTAGEEAVISDGQGRAVDAPGFDHMRGSRAGSP